MTENPDVPHQDPILAALEREFGAAANEYLLGVNATLAQALGLPRPFAKADDERAVSASRAKRIFEALRQRERPSPRALAAAVTEQWYGEARVESRAQAAAIRAYLAGRIRSGLLAPIDRAANLQALARQVTASDPGGQRALAYAQERAAELVQGLDDATRKAVALEVIEHQLTPAGSTARLEGRLNDTFATLNRDNRRVAITETAINHQNGFLGGVEPGREVEFSAAPDACPHCGQFHGKRFMVVAEPGDHHTQVWVGKSNFGRSFHKRKIDGSYRTPDELAGPVAPAHPHCYSGDTEVYTENGWKSFPDVCDGERIFAINPDTREMEFVPFVARVAYRYQGDMLRFTSNSLDLLVTPDHSMYVETRVKRATDERRRWRGRLLPAADLERRGSWRIPRTGIWRGADPGTIRLGDLTLPTATYAAFMGYYLSEGSITDRRASGKDWHQVSIAQHAGPTRDRIRALLDTLPFNTWQGEKATTFRAPPGLADHLAPLGHSHEKHVPAEIKSLTPELITIFLEAYLEGDGRERTCERPDMNLTSRERQFATSSRRMADDLGELILKAGGYPGYYLERRAGIAVEHRNGSYITNRDMWLVRWNRSHNALYERTRDTGVRISREAYDGMVYDVELLKHHVLLVRRNGRTAWSGNCRCLWLLVVAGAPAGTSPEMLALLDDLLALPAA